MRRLRPIRLQHVQHARRPPLRRLLAPGGRDTSKGAGTGRVSADLSALGLGIKNSVDLAISVKDSPQSTFGLGM